MRRRSLLPIVAVSALLAAAVRLADGSSQASVAGSRVQPTALTKGAMAPAGDFDGDGRGDLVTAGRSDLGVSGAVVVLEAQLTSQGTFARRIVRISKAPPGDSDSVSSVGAAGDLNADGLADIVLIGAVGDPSGSAGALYVVYGSRTAGDVDLDRPELLAGRGFVLRNVDRSARASGAGDVNGDGVDDLVVGIPETPGLFGGNPDFGKARGRAYVVFGSRSAAPVRDASALAGGGFRIDPGAGDHGLGGAVDGAGDVNADGLADIIVGAPGSGRRPAGSSRYEPARPGAAYVVFGKRDAATVTLGAPGPAALRIDGELAAWGTSVAGVGDVNGDGLDDVALGGPLRRGPLPARVRERLGLRPLPRARRPPGSLDLYRGQLDLYRARGAAAIVFGRRDARPVSLQRLGADGLRIDGVRPAGRLGTVILGVGDIDGDGLADVGVAEFGPVETGDVAAFRDAFQRPGRVHVVHGRRVPGRVAAGAPQVTKVLSESDAADAPNLAAGSDLDADGRPELLVATSYVCSSALLAFELTDPASLAGTGPQTLRGGAGSDQLLGRDGRDRLLGLDGDDCLHGGAGDDELLGGDEHDTLLGGGGEDRLLGGGEDDELQGGSGDDVLDGGPGDDRSLRGSDGRDTIRGGAGSDILVGGFGNDRLLAGAGGDVLEGGNGRDRLAGGAGVDQLTGGPGADHLSGGTGRDQVADRDGYADVVDCGPGRDTAVLDRHDRVRGCEIVRRGRPPRP